MSRSVILTHNYADLVTVSNILGAWKGQMVPEKAKLVRGWKKDHDLGGSYYRKESAASSPMDQSQHVQFAE